MSNSNRLVLILVSAAVVVGLVVGVLATREDTSTGAEAPVNTTQPTGQTLEATTLLGQIENDLALKPLQIEVGASTFSLLPAAIGFEVDEQATINAALGEHSIDGILEDIRRWREDPATDLSWSLAGTVNESALDDLMSLYESALDVPEDGSIIFRESGPVPVYPRPGEAIDREASLLLIADSLLKQPRTGSVRLPTVRKDPILSDADVDLAMETATALLSGPITLARSDPDAILHLSVVRLADALTTEVSEGADPSLEVSLDRDVIDGYLDNLRGQFEAPPRNAQILIDEGNVVFTEGLSGAVIDVDLVLRAIHQAAGRESRQSVLPLQTGVQPEFDIEDLQASGPIGLISEFTTRHSCCQPRVGNIQLMAATLDNLNLLPGERFSLNETVGKRTLEDGYLPAPTIVRGELTDEVGGGVSQFATTFYNAVFWAGMEVIDHKPHSWYFSRYPMGIEATVSWPTPDLVFRNNTDAPLVIDTSYTSTSITVAFYGNNSDREVTATVSPPYNFTDFEKKFEPNPEIMPWEAPVEVGNGSQGFQVTVTRNISYTDGTSAEEKWNVKYRPQPHRFEIHPCFFPEDSEDYTGEECPSHPDFPDGFPDPTVEPEVPVPEEVGDGLDEEGLGEEDPDVVPEETSGEDILDEPEGSVSVEEE
ncbi:MAG: VanW family protein [bacterium]|nr:VanW family protein [bacterium]